jgi:hypothetical protein
MASSPTGGGPSRRRGPTGDQVGCPAFGRYRRLSDCYNDALSSTGLDPRCKEWNCLRDYFKGCKPSDLGGESNNRSRR